MAAKTIFINTSEAFPMLKDRGTETSPTATSFVISKGKLAYQLCNIEGFQHIYATV